MQDCCCCRFRISKLYLLNRFDVLQQTFFVNRLKAKKSRSRRVSLRVKRVAMRYCRVGITVTLIDVSELWGGQMFPLSITAKVGDTTLTSSRNHLLFSLDSLSEDETANATIMISGLSESLVIVGTGAEVSIVTDEATPIKATGERAILGVSASHNASAVLLVGERFVSGIQLERLTRVKHDGQPLLSHNDAIDYCLNAAGLTISDIDTFAFNIQALTPEYVGLSQPVALPSFRSFDPFAATSLFVSHHLCHAFAGYCGSQSDSASVVVADGCGGVTVGNDDLMLTGPELEQYLRTGKGKDPLSLHVFSVYIFTNKSFLLKYREYAPSFNIRSGSASLGETYAAVSQFVFGSWQASGKLMGLAPYGKVYPEETYLQRGLNGQLNFGFEWKLSYSLGKKADVMQFANLAARIQLDLEHAIVDRFKLHVGSGKNIVFSGGVALNSVTNHRVRTELHPSKLYLLPAQNDAGIAIGAAAAALFRATGTANSKLFTTDFLGYRYSERDAALAINK